MSEKCPHLNFTHEITDDKITDDTLSKQFGYVEDWNNDGNMPLPAVEVPLDDLLFRLSGTIYTAKQFRSGNLYEQKGSYRCNIWFFTSETYALLQTRLTKGTETAKYEYKAYRIKACKHNYVCTKCGEKLP
jgi:hypothetical protein